MDNEMGGACSAYGEGEACTGFYLENLRERYHLRHPGVDLRIILRWIYRKWDVVCTNWSELAQDRDRWLTFVNIYI
jgi:hypothetical protein